MAIFKNCADALVCLAPYHSYSMHKAMGGNSLNFDRHSGRILDFKQGRRDAIEEFAGKIEPLLGDSFAICVVPSHDPAQVAGPLHVLASILAGKNGRADASGCIVRHSLIQKLATGGNRDKSVHLGSLKVIQQDLVNGRDVLLLDDVTTSGGSIEGCRELLQKTGARSVGALCLGRST